MSESNASELTPILSNFLAGSMRVGENRQFVDQIADAIAKLVVGDQNDQNIGARRLVEAIQSQDEEVIKYLLNSSNINPNVLLPTGQFPIHLCTKLRENACAMMIALASSKTHPLNLNVQDSEGNTALHVATALAKPESVNFLLQGKADPNILNSMGDTPLHIACKIKAPEIACKILADERTNPTIKNKNGKAANQIDESPESQSNFMNHTLKNLKALGELKIALSWKVVEGTAGSGTE